MGKNQPDIFEVDYKDRQRLAPFALSLSKMFSSEYEESVFSFIYDQPGAVAGKIYYMPFRLRWQAFLYNSERIAEVPADMNAFGALCKDHPGGFGLALSDDDVLVKFMLSTIWAFNGNEFDLDNERTKQALYFFSSLSSCLSSFSSNYDAESLANALARGEVDFAFAEMSTTRKLWESGSYPYPVAGNAFPGVGSIAFSGTYLGINKDTRKANESYALGFYLTEPKTCERVIENGLWLCGLPGLEKPNLPPARVDLFKPYLSSALRLRPVPPGVDFSSLAQIYRELFTRIVLKSEQVELVSAELSLKLKQLAPAH